MKSIEDEFFMTGWRQPHAWDPVSNSSKHYILSGTELIQLYKFVYTIPTQISNINLRCKPSLVVSYDIPG